MSTSFATRFDQLETMNVYIIDPDRIPEGIIRKSLAKTYKDIIIRTHPLITGRLNLARLDYHVEDIRAALQDFDPDRDRILVVGRSMPNFLAGVLLGTLGLSRVMLLMYSGRTATYQELPLLVAPKRRLTFGRKEARK